MLPSCSIAKAYWIIFFLLFSLIHPLSSDITTQPQLAFERGFIPHPDQPENQIEFFYLFPAGTGPFPTLFLLPGWQPQERSKGGKELGEFGYLHRLVEEGIAAVSISLPGYGHSDGKRDFGGPYSQRAVCACIDYFKNNAAVNAAKMGIYGISRGAPLSAMVVTQCPDLKLQILESGFYDLFTFPWPMPKYLEGIQDSLFKETDGTEEALSQRSPVYHAKKMKVASLILHGAFDDRRGLASAKELYEALHAEGLRATFKIYPHAAHCLTSDKWEEIIPFLRSHFFDLSGIGVSFTQATPAIQIAKILPHSPAELTGKLKVGDAILSISPNNDAKDIDTLNMSKKEFLSLVLGKPGTCLRLHVQHFDLTCEDVVVQRGFP